MSTNCRPCQLGKHCKRCPCCAHPCWTRGVLRGERPYWQVAWVDRSGDYLHGIIVLRPMSFVD